MRGPILTSGRCGRDRMVVDIRSNYAISAYHPNEQTNNPTGTNITLYLSQWKKYYNIYSCQN